MECIWRGRLGGILRGERLVVYDGSGMGMFLCLW